MTCCSNTVGGRTSVHVGGHLFPPALSDSCRASLLPASNTQDDSVYLMVFFATDEDERSTYCRMREDCGGFREWPISCVRVEANSATPLEGHLRYALTRSRLPRFPEHTPQGTQCYVCSAFFNAIQPSLRQPRYLFRQPFVPRGRHVCVMG